MVPDFTVELYLTSLTTGQSFRKQDCWLKQNSLRWGYLPPGKIWSRSLNLNVIQRSPAAQKTKPECILLTDLPVSRLTFLPEPWKLFLLRVSVAELGMSFPIVPQFSPVSHQLQSFGFLVWVRPTRSKSTKRMCFQDASTHMDVMWRVPSQ